MYIYVLGLSSIHNCKPTKGCVNIIEMTEICDFSTHHSITSLMKEQSPIRLWAEESSSGFTHAGYMPSKFVISQVLEILC